MMIIDKTDLIDAVGFIQTKLNFHDTSNLDHIKFLPLKMTRRYHGRCDYPKRVKKGSRKFIHGYQIRCSVNVLPAMFPKVMDLPVGTWQGENQWGYHYEIITLNSPSEACVLIGGHEIFHFLRHSRQIDGRNTEPSANKFGIEWLREFRGSN